MSTTTITVSGMSCGGCASAVRAELIRVPGVIDIDIELSDGTVTIGSDGSVDAAAIKAAVQEAGYELAG